MFYYLYTYQTFQKAHKQCTQKEIEHMRKNPLQLALRLLMTEE